MLQLLIMSQPVDFAFALATTRCDVCIVFAVVVVCIPCAVYDPVFYDMCLASLHHLCGVMFLGALLPGPVVESMPDYDKLMSLFISQVAVGKKQWAQKVIPSLQAKPKPDERFLPRRCSRFAARTEH